jgi:hypothetical protein
VDQNEIVNSTAPLPATTFVVAPLLDVEYSTTKKLKKNEDTVIFERSTTLSCRCSCSVHEDGALANWSEIDES